MARALAVALAVGVALYPRSRPRCRSPRWRRAVTIAVQLTAAHWFYFYVVWFLPFALVGELRRPAADVPERARVPEGA